MYPRVGGASLNTIPAPLSGTVHGPGGATSLRGQTSDVEVYLTCWGVRRRRKPPIRTTSAITSGLGHWPPYDALHRGPLWGVGLPAPWWNGAQDQSLRHPCRLLMGKTASGIDPNLGEEVLLPGRPARRCVLTPGTGQPASVAEIVDPKIPPYFCGAQISMRPVAMS